MRAVATLTREPTTRLIAGPLETSQARALLDDVAQPEGDRLPLSAAAAQGGTVAVPAELARLLGRILQTVATGGTVTVGTLPEELTTTVAAEQLGVSRPTLLKMVAESQIPAHKVGTHTRFKTEDVMKFRRARLVRQRTALQELLDLEDELDELEPERR